MVGISYAADVIKREKQLILVLRECVTSYTASCLIDDERRDTLRDSLVKLCIGLRPLDGPPACFIRTDPAPGFAALVKDALLSTYRLTIELGRVKNVNKNLVAEKAVCELEHELLHQQPTGRTECYKVAAHTLDPPTAYQYDDSTNTLLYPATPDDAQSVHPIPDAQTPVVPDEERQESEDEENFPAEELSRRSTRRRRPPEYLSDFVT